MGLVKIKDTNAVGKWNKNIPFPKNRYAARCISTKFAPSNNGNPMITLEWELCQSEPVRLGDKLLDIDGLKTQTYHTIKVFADGEVDTQATMAAQSNFSELLSKVGYEEESFDDENPPHQFFKGKVVDVIVYGKKQQSFQEPTTEQKAKGMRVGDPIKGPDGRDTVQYQLAFDIIYGLSTVEVGRPY